MDNSTPLFSITRRVGTVSSVSSSHVKINLTKAGLQSGTVYEGSRYGLGEVGEFVIIESEQNAIFGRITEIRLPEKERLSVESQDEDAAEIHPIAFVQLLATIGLEDFKIVPGIHSYPRLRDSVFSSPHYFNAQIPILLSKSDASWGVTLQLGYVKNAKDTAVSISPEKLFGRHCGILGATGGGKSYTLSKLVGETKKYDSKIILLDATGEYRDLDGEVEHWHFGDPFEKAASSKQCSMPSTSFQESDFIALFEPSGKVQAPKLRAAIRSLRLAKLEPVMAPKGIIEKHGVNRTPILQAEHKHSAKLEDPTTPFDTRMLVSQIRNECVNYWDGQVGKADEAGFGYCSSMVTRIAGIITSKAFEPVFRNEDKEPIEQVVEKFYDPNNTNKVLRICLSGIQSEFNAKDIIVNSIGRILLNKSRKGDFRNQPTVLFLDEAHGFIGKSFGAEDYRTKLDAFEIIAKEGRKYGLNLCLATQRPRDLPDGVISQLGTLLVHRLSNDKDREMVERACGEIDRSASSFLPNLQPGEVVLLGVDFPIPMTIQMELPETKPKSDGADFQSCWSLI